MKFRFVQACYPGQAAVADSTYFRLPWLVFECFQICFPDPVFSA